MRVVVFLFIGLLSGFLCLSQTVCTGLGQNPSTAFPVCGTSMFQQTTVPLCGGRALPSPGCRPETETEDVNPYWYKFTCFQAGTLGFLITSANLQDDYDWELYDVTGKNPDNVYSDGTLVVSSNWSGEGGLTGASSTGTKATVCGGPGQDLFSKMPSLQLGHDYLLLISHFTPTQSGYSLEFKGGTAVITDPAPPKLKRAEANCGGDKLRISLNKKMKCNSIAPNGSDFFITPAGATIIGIAAINCNTGFDTDSIELTLDQLLSPGNYTLQVKTGSDGNTILDNCNVGIPVNDAAPFTILPKAPTLMDSLAPVSCAPQELKLVFKKPMLCSSIAADGSDFIITGNYPVAVTTATGNCNGGITREIIVHLSLPLQQQGNFTILLQRGTDGNTLFDECNEETPVGSRLDFAVKDTVNADFTYSIQYGCDEDLVDYFHPGLNGINRWQWNLDENLRRSQQNPLISYKVFKNKTVELIVSNGFCNDTSKQIVALDNFLQADFTVFEDNCPLEPILFTNHSIGKNITHLWDFADGNSSMDPSPVHIYERPNRARGYRVSYTITDEYGCTSTSEKVIKIYPSCYIDLPNAFTPNGDGINDIFYPLNAVKADNLDLKVYNRWGQLVFTTDNWKKGWDGRYQNELQSSGVYIWTLRYTDRDTKRQIQRKGTVILSR